MPAADSCLDIASLDIAHDVHLAALLTSTVGSPFGTPLTPKNVYDKTCVGTPLDAAELGWRLWQFAMKNARKMIAENLMRRAKRKASSLSGERVGHRVECVHPECF